MADLKDIIDVVCYDNMNLLLVGELIIDERNIKIVEKNNSISERVVNCKFSQEYETIVKINNVDLPRFKIFEKYSYSVDVYNIIDEKIRFYIDESQVERIKNIEKAFNEKFIILSEKCKEEVYKLVEKADKKDNIRDICINYLKKTPQEIFINHEYMFYFESLLFRKFGGTIHMLLENEYSSFIKENMFENVDINKMETVECYLQEYFTKLVNVIKNHTDTKEEKQLYLLVWKLLINQVCDFFADSWIKGKEEHFKEVDKLSIDELVKAYCNLELIILDNLINIGSFTYYLMKNKKFVNGENFAKVNLIILNKINSELENKNINLFEQFLTSDKDNIKYTINDIDLMNGYEFESFIGEVFERMGYSTTVTKSSGDQGIDIIAEKNGQKIGIQAKCYSTKVTNSAIQEVVAGLKYYSCSKGIVVTNNYFTDSAIELANKNDIVLWDRDMLMQKIKEIFN